MTREKTKIRALVLIAPLLVFIVLFFLWPLGVMMKQAISDTAVPLALPRTVAALHNYNDQDGPTPEMQQAFVADLQASTDAQAMGDVIRRLNSAQPGFRTLMTRTISAVKDKPAPDLATIDKRWNQPEYWRAIHGALSPWTDRNLLAAIDMERDASGKIAAKDAGASANLAIMIRTFWIAGLVTLACALIGYPYAILLAGAKGWVRNLLFAAVLLPLWTSLLVRTAAWFILLQDKGLINDLVIWLGLSDHPLPLIFNRAGVVIAMTHVLLPFMVLPIYSVLISIPASLMPAAASLGAAPWRAFLRVLLPLSMRGVLSGMLLVFMSAIGYYITPALIGGPGDQMISSIIAYYATGAANWGMAGALGMVLLTACLLLYTLYGRLTAEEKARA